MECSIEGCERVARYAGTGWCQTHYHRYWRTGSLDILPKELRTDLTYFGAHGRVKAQLGPANLNPCIECGSRAEEWAYDGTDPTARSGLVGEGWPVTYSVWPEFYKPMCRPCHRLMDASARAARRTHCGRGHGLTPENTYEPPGSPGHRECRTCRKAGSAERYARKKLERVAPIHLKEE